MRLWPFIAATCVAVAAEAQVFSPAQEADLRQRYLSQTGFSGAVISPGTLPPDRMVNTGLTYASVFSGVVTGKYPNLGLSSNATPRLKGLTFGYTDFLVDGTLRFNASSGRMELYNGGWQPLAGGISRLFSGSASASSASELGLESSSTNIQISLLGTNGVFRFIMTPVGPIGVKGDNGAGNMWWAGSWLPAQPYSTNTLVSYGGQVYATRVNLLAGNTNTPLDTAAYLLAVTAGSDGVDGLSGYGFVWRGSWGNATGYSGTQGVAHAGSVWVSVVGSTNVEPGVAGGWSNYWTLAVERGDEGGSVASNLLWTGTTYTNGLGAVSNGVYVYGDETWAALRGISIGSNSVPSGANTSDWIRLAAKGVNGVNGTDGTDGADGVGNMWFEEEWDSLVAYSSNTLVVRNEQLYYSKVDVAAGTDPATQPTYWGIAARRGNDGLNYYFGGLWSGIVAYSNNALVFYSTAWWQALQANSGVTPGTSTSYWRRLVEVLPNTNRLVDVVANGGALALSWATNIPAQQLTGTVPLASLSGITDAQIDPATDAAYRNSTLAVGGNGGTNSPTLVQFRSNVTVVVDGGTLFVDAAAAGAGGSTGVSGIVVGGSNLVGTVAMYGARATVSGAVFAVEDANFADRRPDAPTAWDDEFDAPLVTTNDQALATSSWFSVTGRVGHLFFVTNGSLCLVHTGVNTGHSLSVLSKKLPDSPPYFFVAKMHHTAWSNRQYAGIAITQTNGGKSILLQDMRNNGTAGGRYEFITAMNTPTSVNNENSISFLEYGNLYYGWRNDGTNFWAAWSTDGAAWNLYTSGTTNNPYGFGANFNARNIALEWGWCAGGNTNNPPHVTLVDWFRRIE